MNAIVGFSNVLTSGEYSGEEQKTFVEVIQTNSDLLLRLIGDIFLTSSLQKPLFYNYLINRIL